MADPMHAPGVRRRRIHFLGGLTLALIAGTFYFVPAVPQDPEFHCFADRREILGIPNFMDVMSNLPFLAIGLLGIGCARRLPRQRTPFLVLFAAVAATAFGSSAYHLDPTNATLAWDRLPITVTFMALLAVVAGDRLGEDWGRRLLTPLVVAGAGAVLYWHLTEQAGAGDLRPYGLVTLAPLLLIPIMVALFPRSIPGHGWLWWAFGAYLGAKAGEVLDHEAYGILGAVSGHTLKHLFAALATWFLLKLAAARALSGGP